MPSKHLPLLALLTCAASIVLPHSVRANGNGFHGILPPALVAPGDPDSAGAPVPSRPGTDDHRPFLSGSSDPAESGSDAAFWPLNGKVAAPLESLNIRVEFTPASSGSATSALGFVHAIHRGGVTTGSVSIHTTALPAGDYTVTGLSLSGTAPVTLGTFTVGASGSQSQFRDHHADAVEVQFPASFDPFALSALAISDSNATLLFTADLATIADASFFASAPLVSGTTSFGHAEVRAYAKGGIVNGALLLTAKDLPTSTTYTYAVDGADVANVTTGSAGTLKLLATEKPTGGTLPSGINLFMVTTVTLHDASGNLILSAGF